MYVGHNELRTIPLKQTRVISLSTGQLFQGKITKILS